MSHPSCSIDSLGAALALFTDKICILDAFNPREKKSNKSQSDTYGT